MTLDKAGNEAPRGRGFFSDNSMTLALLGLFLGCIAVQAVTGWRADGPSRAAAHLPPLDFVSFLGTGQFLDGVFSNWQAAILQLAVLVSFSSVLRQRGAAHSRKGVSSPRTLVVKLKPRKTLRKWLYANSLSLALLGIFLTCFFLHALFGAWKYNEQQMLRGLAGKSVASYVMSPDFWASAFECWEAEFGAIATYIIFSIYLRQENSPESKHVEARDDETGDTNE